MSCVLCLVSCHSSCDNLSLTNTLLVLIHKLFTHDCYCNQVLAVLTTLVDVYEAAALASLAAAQELVSTLRSAINAIDETITGSTGGLGGSMDGYTTFI